MFVGCFCFVGGNKGLVLLGLGLVGSIDVESPIALKKVQASQNGCNVPSRKSNLGKLRLRSWHAFVMVVDQAVREYQYPHHNPGQQINIVEKNSKARINDAELALTEHSREASPHVADVMDKEDGDSDSNVVEVKRGHDETGCHKMMEHHFFVV